MTQKPSVGYSTGGLAGAAAAARDAEPVEDAGRSLPEGRFGGEKSRIGSGSVSTSNCSLSSSARASAIAATAGSDRAGRFREAFLAAGRAFCLGAGLDAGYSLTSVLTAFGFALAAGSAFTLPAGLGLALTGVVGAFLLKSRSAVAISASVVSMIAYPSSSTGG